jgi:hypothetical protein
MSDAKQGGDWPILRPPVDHGEVFPAAAPRPRWGRQRTKRLTHVNPGLRSSRSAMASTSVKGRVCATQKPTEFYVCRKADPHAEVHDHSIPNFTITKGVGLWARTHPKKEDRTDTLPGRDSSLIKLVTRLFQADCHEWHGGARRRALPGGGSGRYTSQRILIEDQGFCGRRSPSERAPCLAGTLSISSPLGQRAREGVGGHTKTVRHRRRRVP